MGTLGTFPKIRADSRRFAEDLWLTLSFARTTGARGRSSCLDREDPAPDEQFYLEPRKVVHIDLYAIQAVTDLYRELVPANGVVLDLMSAWRSHLPTEVKYQRVVGLGMNVDEMADNPELNKFVVHNLNSGEPLPFENNTFDAALCAVSVQYLTRPVETFTEVARVLKKCCEPRSLTVIRASPSE